MNLDKNKRLEVHGWKVGKAEEFLELSEEERTMLNEVYKNRSFLEKYGVKITSIKEYHETQAKLPKILQQLNKVYPEVTTFVKNYIKSAETD